MFPVPKAEGNRAIVRKMVLIEYLITEGKIACFWAITGENRVKHGRDGFAPDCVISQAVRSQR
jgi:hypothetical protein